MHTVHRSRSASEIYAASSKERMDYRARRRTNNSTAPAVLGLRFRAVHYRRHSAMATRSSLASTARTAHWCSAAQQEGVIEIEHNQKKEATEESEQERKTQAMRQKCVRPRLDLACTHTWHGAGDPLPRTLPQARNQGERRQLENGDALPASLARSPNDRKAR